MFSTKTIAIAAAALAFATAGIQGASAAHFDRGFYGRDDGAAVINHRIRRQARRIRRARADGRLNWLEARRARFELSHIRGFRSRYLRDGYLSFRERRHLRRLLNRNSRRIYRMATNSRYGRGSFRLFRSDRRYLNGFR